MAEGTTIRDLENPDRALIGGMDTEEGKAAIKGIVSVYANWISRERIIITNLCSSELTKLVPNALRV